YSAFRCATGLRGNHVTFDTSEFLVLENHDDTAGLLQPPRLLLAADVVPTMLVERIPHGRRDRDEPHPGLCHSRLQLRHHVLGDDVTLLYVYLVRGQRWQHRHLPASDKE